MDVRSLYTNIPNNEGRKTFNTTNEKETLNKSYNQLSEVNINIEQFYIRPHKPFTDKRMCNRNKMHPNIRKPLYGYI